MPRRRSAAWWRTLRVATDATYPPFEMLDEQKNLIGYDIDLIREICRLANCRPEIRSVAWEGILPGVQQGDYDVAISGITINAALRALEQDGTLDRLHRKWFEEWKPQ